MKYKLTLLFFSFFFIGIAQKSNDFVIYVDSTHSFCKEKEHQYIRVIKDYYLDKESYVFAEYYKSGKIALKGTTKDKNTLKLEGTIINYYENGNRKQVSNYSNLILNGKQFGWYEDGTSEFEKEFYFDKTKKKNIEKIIQYWDKNHNHNVIDGNGFYSKSILLDTSDSNLNATFFSENGEIKNGLREGIWTGESEKYKISFKETYNEGELINGVSTDKENIEYPYTEVVKKPIPKNGMDSFYKYIGQKLTLPRITPSYENPRSTNSINGKIILSFVVNKEGKLVNTKIIQDIGYGMGNEASRLITKAESWIPGQIRGILADFSFHLPISIRN